MKILIRFDDIAENMNWHLMDKCEKLFDKYEIKPVLGVIPNNQDLELKSYPRKENFWQIVNLVIPILFILLFGLLINVRRKQKYSNEK